MTTGSSRYERTRCYRRGWVFERAGWAAMAVLITAAALGLFGGGWLDATTASAGEAFTVEYPRFGRARAPLELRVEWLPRQPEATLWIARAYLDEFSIEDIHPPPLAASVSTDRIYYAFRVVGSEARVRVTFTLKPERGGALRGRVGLDEEPAAEVEVRQLLFP